MSVDVDFKIRIIKEEIRKTPYHKGTEHYIGHLRARLAKLRQQKQAIKPRAGGRGFALKKSGDATVVLVGPPSVGKSSLLNKLTRAQSRVEEWPFTTVEVIPGMLQYKGAQIQILDLPGLIKGTAEGKGRGKEVLSVIRLADLAILMVDVRTEKELPSLVKELKKLKIDLPILTVINKVDLLTKLPKNRVKGLIYVSVQEGTGLQGLKETIWQELNLMRVYLKPKDEEPDFKEPLILKRGDKVALVAGKLFPEKKKFKQILIWGPSARFPGQQVSLDHSLEDRDILTFI